MSKSSDVNFAGRLVGRLGENSVLTEAASGRTLRGREIADAVVGHAAGFLASGLQARDRVLISCGVNAASTLAYLGAMYAGIVPVLLDERMLAASGSAAFMKANAKAAWTDGRAGWEWARQSGFLQLEGNLDASSAASCSIDSLQPFPCNENNLAALMPTSGSTGVPRLVMVSHGNLISNTEAIIRSQRLENDEKALLIMPVSYCFGASVMHTHLYQGGGVVFDPRFMFPDKALQSIDTYQCTTFAGVPTVYNILLRRSHIQSMKLPSLRRFLQAGGALAKESVRELCGIVPSAQLFVMYGQTEATSRISCLPPECLSNKLGSVGLPLDNLTIRIVDDQDRDVAVGQTGEIQISGPSVCQGYLDEAEATLNKFDHGWLKTGDLAAVDEDGYLWIKGRTSDFIKIRGYRVGLAEVEAKVAAVPGVSECAAMGVQHPEAGEAIVLFIVEEGGAFNNETSTLAERVRHALPVQWTCSSVQVVAELPKTANGKIARSQLQEAVSRGIA
jgi:acyl-CoA synthetase (AMP-forming)/AMP-acid ligase II